MARRCGPPPPSEGLQQAGTSDGSGCMQLGDIQFGHNCCFCLWMSLENVSVKVDSLLAIIGLRRGRVVEFASYESFCGRRDYFF
eukprot:scaffold89883_cov15-Prasinocladus_malaysianus.AAC.1